MRDTIRRITETDVRQLTEKWGIDVACGEVNNITEQVNERLADGLDAVYDIPVPSGASDPGERPWSEGTDRYNAIRVNCSVPPTADAGDLLDGVTVGLKDLIAVAGVPMRCGSAVMDGFVPSRDATVVTRLRQTGATIAAKTTMDEFAGGGRGRTARGLVCNPLDEDRIAGGSSGGSGAAVAAGLVDVALGTDTGGSTRKPAAFCGVVGLKPTYGLIPLTGVIENTYSLDHVGLIARSLADTARVLEALAGPDAADPVSTAAAGEYEYRVGGYTEAVLGPSPVDDLRVGVATQGLTDDIHEAVATRHRAAGDAIEDEGATLIEVDIPYLDETKHLKNAISYTELAAFWRDGGAPIRRGGSVAPGDRAGFQRRAIAASGELNTFYRSRMLAGAHLADAHGARHYVHARAAQATVRDALAAEFTDVDVLVTPTVPALAPPVEAVTAPDFDYDGLQSAFGYGRYTKFANVTGVPALTVPNCVEEGPAVGLQILAPRFEEARLLAAASQLADVVGFDRE
jgi:amidase/aspartyl-tRNA(Asn)/glutamyl-tRNA(Gln) amidotransferase subunit A